MKRASPSVRARAETLVSRGREAANGVQTRLAERTGRLSANRRRMVAVGGAVVLGVVLVLMIGINLAANPDALNRVLVDLQLKEPTLGDGLLVSGFIEAEEVDLAAEISGRVVELPFEEGDEVEAGDVVVRLSSGTLEAELAAARARLDVALAEQAIVENGARPELVAQTRAGRDAARAARDAAYDAWQDAIAMRDNPQTINLQLAQAYTQAAVAGAQANAAQANYDRAAHIQYLYLETPGVLDTYLGRGANPEIPADERTAGDQAWQAQEARDIAQATLAGANNTLGAVAALRDDPQALEAQVVNAEAQYQAAEARLAEAQARLELMLRGASDEQLAAALANVEQAEAVVERLEREVARLTITAPRGGVVLDRAVLEGELAAPGVTLVTLADLDEVRLTVYVPEDQLDRVSIGQPVSVSVDSFPDRVFEGRVATIASEAEFTPRSVVTREERVSLVFAVTIRLPNPDHALKPGMPADAVLNS